MIPAPSKKRKPFKIYTPEERNIMVKYIVQHNGYADVKGNTLYKKMEAEKVLNRSAQSMWEHFRKKIGPYIHTSRFDLTVRQRLTFLKYCESWYSVNEFRRVKQRLLELSLKEPELEEENVDGNAENVIETCDSPVQEDILEEEPPDLVVVEPAVHEISDSNDRTTPELNHNPPNCRNNLISDDEDIEIVPEVSLREQLSQAYDFIEDLSKKNKKPQTPEKKPTKKVSTKGKRKLYSKYFDDVYADSEFRNVDIEKPPDITNQEDRDRSKQKSCLKNSKTNQNVNNLTKNSTIEFDFSDSSGDSDQLERCKNPFHSKKKKKPSPRLSKISNYFRSTAKNFQMSESCSQKSPKVNGRPSRIIFEDSSSDSSTDETQLERNQNLCTQNEKSPNPCTQKKKNPNLCTQMEKKSNSCTQMGKNSNLCTQMDKDPNSRIQKEKGSKSCTQIEKDLNLSTRKEKNQNSCTLIEKDMNSRNRIGKDPNYRPQMKKDPNSGTQMEKDSNSCIQMETISNSRTQMEKDLKSCIQKEKKQETLVGEASIEKKKIPSKNSKETEVSFKNRNSASQNVSKSIQSPKLKVLNVSHINKLPDYRFDNTDIIEVSDDELLVEVLPTEPTRTKENINSVFQPLFVGKGNQLITLMGSDTYKFITKEFHTNVSHDYVINVDDFLYLYFFKKVTDLMHLACNAHLNNLLTKLDNDSYELKCDNDLSETAFLQRMSTISDFLLEQFNSDVLKDFKSTFGDVFNKNVEVVEIDNRTNEDVNNGDERARIADNRTNENVDNDEERARIADETPVQSCSDLEGIEEDPVTHVEENMPEYIPDEVHFELLDVNAQEDNQVLGDVIISSVHCNEDITIKAESPSSIFSNDTIELSIEEQPPEIAQNNTCQQNHNIFLGTSSLCKDTDEELTQELNTQPPIYYNVLSKKRTKVYSNLNKTNRNSTPNKNVTEPTNAPAELNIGDISCILQMEDFNDINLIKSSNSVIEVCAVNVDLDVPQLIKLPETESEIAIQLNPNQNEVGLPSVEASSKSTPNLLETNQLRTSKEKQVLASDIIAAMKKKLQESLIVSESAAPSNKYLNKVTNTKRKRGTPCSSAISGSSPQSDKNNSPEEGSAHQDVNTSPEKGSSVQSRCQLEKSPNRHEVSSNLSNSQVKTASKRKRRTLWSPTKSGTASRSNTQLDTNTSPKERTTIQSSDPQLHTNKSSEERITNSNKHDVSSNLSTSQVSNVSKRKRSILRSPTKSKVTEMDVTPSPKEASSVSLKTGSKQSSKLRQTSKHSEELFNEASQNTSTNKRLRSANHSQSGASKSRRITRSMCQSPLWKISAKSKPNKKRKQSKLSQNKSGNDKNASSGDDTQFYTCESIRSSQRLSNNPCSQLLGKIPSVSSENLLELFSNALNERRMSSQSEFDSTESS